MFNFKEISKLVEEIMPSPLRHLTEACEHPGIVYETGMSHNGIKVGICYMDSISHVIAISAAGKIKTTAGEDIYCIFVDKNFANRLTYNMQLVLFYHEMGHIVNGHTDQDKARLVFRNIARIVTGHSKYEYDADMYAALKTSKQDVEETLNFVKGIFRVSKRDINVRLRKLNAFSVKEVA